jgi:hypothetical protein
MTKSHIGVGKFVGTSIQNGYSGGIFSLKDQQQFSGESLWTPPVITSGLVARYEAFNSSSYSGSGSTWNDVSGNGNTLTMSGQSYSSSSVGGVSAGGTLTFSNGYATRDHSGTTATLMPTRITVSTWAYRSSWSSITTQQNFLSKTEGGGYQLNIGEMSADPTGTSYGFLIMINGVYYSPTYPKTSISNGWHNFAGSFDGRYIKIYIDGIEVGSYDYGSTANLQYNAPAKFVVANEANGDSTPSGAASDAIYSQLLVYNKALSAGEISQNYSATKSRYGK